MTDPIIIVGSGLAGYTTAREFRKHNKEASLIIITADAGDYYSKPQLSTALSAHKTAAELVIANATKMATQLNATIVPNTLVDSIDTQNRTIKTLSNSYSYSKLVLAIGAEPVTPKFEQIDQLTTVNDIYDYQLFRTKLEDCTSVSIIGAGLVGCEFANDLATGKYHVNVIAPDAQPLEKLLPTEIAQRLTSILEKQGVNWYLKQTIKSIEQQNHYVIHLEDNISIKTDLILAATSIRSRTKLAESAGIKVSASGIVADQYLQTSVADVYAIGDCVEINGQSLKYVAPLNHSAKALGKTLNDQASAVEFPIMPIIIKTPSFPLSVYLPPAGMKGQWKYEKNTKQMKALFYNEDNILLGFVLGNCPPKDRLALTEALPRELLLS